MSSVLGLLSKKHAHSEDPNITYLEHRIQWFIQGSADAKCLLGLENINFDFREHLVYQNYVNFGYYSTPSAQAQR